MELNNIQDYPTQEGFSLLHRAAQEGNSTAIKYAIEHLHKDINELNQEGASPLKVAINYNQREAIKTLLAAGANTYNTHVLHYATRLGDTEIINDILSGTKSFDIEEQDEIGYSPLQLAVEEHHNDVAEILIDAGAKVNGGVLLEAAGHGNTELLQYIIHNVKEIDLNEVNQFGYFPLLVAVEGHHNEAAKVLIDAGAKVNCIVLYFAAADRNSDLLKYIIHNVKEIDLNELNILDNSPLAAAFQNYHFDKAFTEQKIDQLLMSQSQAEEAIIQSELRLAPSNETDETANVMLAEAPNQNLTDWDIQG
jgi:ankyrin repeat protein